jgi:zinc/manganese transport system permease protein
LNTALPDALGLIGLPLAAGLLVLVTHLPLGVQVLKRGIVFIDLAIAQIAAVGVIVGGLLFDAGLEPLNGMLFALLGAGLVATLSRYWPQHREAVIGLIYVGAAAVSILVISGDPHGALRLKTLLAGDILWVTPALLWPLGVASGLFAILALTHHERLCRDEVFYPVFAVMVSLSLPVLGVYLVFAALIAPALAVAGTGLDSRSRAAERSAYSAGVWVGGAGFAGGLLLAVQFDLPAGPTVVITLVSLAMANRLYKSVVD